MMKTRMLTRAGVLLCALLAAACDRAPLGSGPGPVPPSGPAGLSRLECSVTVSTGALRCTTPSPEMGGASGLIVGGANGTYVHLAASGHTYTAADSLFSIDVTIQNLIYQPLGAVNDSTADAAGVRIFFTQEPVASVMSPPGAPAEPVDLVNEQRAFFTAANQAYFEYAGLLQPNATSGSAEWQFKVPPAVDRFIFSVMVSAVVPHPDGVVQVTPAADTLVAAQTVSLSHRVVNAVGDDLADQSVAWGTSDAGVATVDAGGMVTAAGVGTAVITATQGTRTGSARIVVCPSLALGAVFVAEMPAHSSFCLAGAGEYVIIPVNTASSSVSLGITGAGIIGVSGPPTPSLMPGGRTGLRAATTLRPDDAWESRLRRLERGTPLRTGPAPRIPGPRMAITPGVPSVGALMSLNVETDNACSTNDIRTGRVMAVGTNVVVIADTMNPAAGFSAADYAAIADSFDARIHPTVTGAFGTPSDRDGNGRVIAFYTRAVNELTAPGSSSYVGGFFFSRDLLPAGGFTCSTSNLGEMFYMLVPDPAGAVNGNIRSVDFVREVTLGTLAHEYEHLVNAARRMHVNTPWNGQLEETWLDEGLAHVAEELMFYQATGLTPRANVDVADLGTPAVQDAFFKYAESNFGRLRQWLLAPQATGPFAGADGLATRGSAWAFLRYAADRRGGTESAFWSALVNTGNRGLANLQAVLGTDPLPWFRDFSAATYADDAFGGTAPPAAYQQPSWDFRGIYTALDYTPGPTCSCSYELAVRNPTNGVTDSFTVAGGGASAYARLGVSPGAFAGVTIRSGSAAPGSTVRVTVVRRE